MIYPIIIAENLGMGYEDMLIGDEFLKSVVYLVTPNGDPVATAFFIGVVIGEGTRARGALPYLVTAKHVIDASRKYGSLYVFANTVNDTSIAPFEAKQDEWILNDKADVAVHFVNPSVVRQINARIYDMGIVGEDYVKRQGIGVGDDIFFVGLFSKHPGKTVIKPVVRFGNISLMPDDIEIELSPNTMSTIRAYLAEVRSWGGHSGSPVYIYYPPFREYGKFDNKVKPIGLLGLVSGHYRIDENVKFKGDILGSGSVPVNTGMAVITPAQDIIDVIMSEDLVKQRKEILDKIKKELAEQESSSIHLDMDKGELTKDAFHRILDKASQPIKPESDSKQS